MHYALPNRQGGDIIPPTTRYQPKTPSRAFGLSTWRRRQMLRLLIAACTLLLITALLLRRNSPASLVEYSTTSTQAVIVTVLDPRTMTPSFIDLIKHNREAYANRHGYELFISNATDFDLGSSPPSWASTPAMRAAISEYPNAAYVFLLNPTALIMNPDISIHEHFFADIVSLQIPDLPVVPPDSVIHTWEHKHAKSAHLILSRDKVGLAHSSLLLRTGPWANFLLDVWYDPLLRSYNFQKAEAHALEHLIQWHPTLTSGLALIPQREINSYSKAATGFDEPNVTYRPGDFVLNALGCDSEPARDCDGELRAYVKPD